MPRLARDRHLEQRERVPDVRGDGGARGVPPLTAEELRQAVTLRRLGRTWAWATALINDGRPRHERLDRREVARAVEDALGHPVERGTP
ncbi:MAG: hypothetical protein VYE22_01090 [Myxococcota bacterium]|nr:hypothetical protein [Myxococcota bacterium]